MRKLLLLLLGLMFIGVGPVHAHANLAGSAPSANASLTESPEEIRLWFTEPLEPSFSRFTVRDSSGTLVPMLESQVDPTNAYQLVMQLGDLPDGLYTVDWRVTSSADGHPSQGSFTFGINAAVGDTLQSVEEAPIPTNSAVIRWLNLLAGSLLVGGIAFTLLVGRPAQLADQTPYQFGTWGFFGIASILVLLLQTSTTADISLGKAAGNSMLFDILTDTNFGELWLARMGLWLAVGVALFWQHHKAALVGGGGILLTQSLFSHASAAEDQWAAVAADWLHLLGTAFWVGGLVAFALALYASPKEKVARMVAAFSDYARIAVALLVVTGTYAAWLHVGSMDALLHTGYGQALLVKLLLFLPLLGIAGINLLWTSRQLQKDEALSWLRGLIGVEIALACSILLAVGVLTAGSPARGTQALKEAASAAHPEPFEETANANDLTIELGISPRIVGQNEFSLTITDENGTPIEDVSLIRLRFEHPEVGQSELRPEPQGGGVYKVEGSNMSLPGDWRIRMTLQRPAQFDTVLDFDLNVQPLPQVIADKSIPVSVRQLILLLTGLALVAVGGFFLPQGGLRRFNGNKLLSGAGLLVGILFLISGVFPNQLKISDVWAYPQIRGMTGAVYLRLENEANASETLIGAESELAEGIEFHRTEMHHDIASMQMSDGILIPAGGNFVMMPGGDHLMLVNLQRDLTPGDTFDITLHFASGKSITTTVMVRSF